MTIDRKASIFIRSHLKIGFGFKISAALSFPAKRDSNPNWGSQTAGTLLYVEDLKRGISKAIGSKGLF
jgi:hypothetical protein